MQTPLKKSHPLKIQILWSLSFWKFVWRFNILPLPCRKKVGGGGGEVHTMIALPSSDFELLRVNWSCSHFFIAMYHYKILSSFQGCWYDDEKQCRFCFGIYPKSILLVQNNISGSLCTVEQKAIIFLPPWSNFEIKYQVYRLILG